MPDTDTFLSLVQCKQSDILPAAFAQHDMTASALGTVPAASRALVLLIHALGAVGGTKIDTPLGSSATQHHPELPCTDFLGLEIAMKQLALQLKDDPAKQYAVNLEQQEIVPVLMCAVSLLLKVADLTPVLSTTEDASVQLWMAIQALARSLKAYTDPPMESRDHQTQGILAHQQQLALIIVQLMLRMLQNIPGIWEACRSSRVTCCFRVLTYLVAWSPTQATALSAICTKANARSLHTILSLCTTQSHTSYTPLNAGTIGNSLGTGMALQYRLCSRLNLPNTLCISPKLLMQAAPAWSLSRHMQLPHTHASCPPPPPPLGLCRLRPQGSSGRISFGHAQQQSIFLFSCTHL